MFLSDSCRSSWSPCCVPVEWRTSVWRASSCTAPRCSMGVLRCTASRGSSSAIIGLNFLFIFETLTGQRGRPRQPVLSGQGLRAQGRLRQQRGPSAGRSQWVLQFIGHSEGSLHGSGQVSSSEAPPLCIWALCVWFCIVTPHLEGCSFFFYHWCHLLFAASFKSKTFPTHDLVRLFNAVSQMLTLHVLTKCDLFWTPIELCDYTCKKNPPKKKACW